MLIYGFKESDFGRCPTCGTARFLRVAHDVEDGGSFWCPSCKGRWRFGDAKEGPLAHAEEAPDLELRVQYEGLLHPDGTMTWYAKGAALTVPEFRAMSRSQSHLDSAARRLQMRLRGADRFVFGRDQTGYYALYMDHSRMLEGYRVGRRREHDGKPTPPAPCKACRGPLVMGTTAYRPRRATGRERSLAPFSWGEFRFCAACVEAKVRVGAVSGLVTLSSSGGSR